MQRLLMRMCGIIKLKIRPKEHNYLMKRFQAYIKVMLWNNLMYILYYLPMTSAYQIFQVEHFEIEQCSGEVN